MLDRIIAQVALALIGYIERRIERGSSAVDAVPDPDRLRRAGTRIREWLRREQGGVHPGSKPDSDGTGNQGKGMDAS